MKLLLHWVLSAIALLVVSQLVSGFHVSGFLTALIGAVVIGFINGTIGFFIKVVTFPFTIITLGIFLLVINAFMLMFAAAILPGFRVDGFGPAFWGALVLSLLNMIIRWLTKGDAEPES
ncbi:MAG TPA: phage holin family protein [Terriglobales bacterium]|nr:phage holin family protein [Terriglobales bacterium]